MLAGDVSITPAPPIFDPDIAAVGPTQGLQCLQECGEARLPSLIICCSRGKHSNAPVRLGAFFDCWSERKHVVYPFEIPAGWLRFRSGDWGSAVPFSFGWWAVASDQFKTAEGVWLPRGCLVRFREWYGMQPSKPNVGLKLHAEEVGKGIAEREQGESIAYGVLDPSAFKEDGGPSIAERIARGSGGCERALNPPHLWASNFPQAGAA